MYNELEYDGRPELRRRRTLEEVPVDSPESIAPAPDDSDPIDDATTTLFTNLGRTYLKGRKIREGLSLMDPEQTIPIRSEASQVKAAASRIDDAASLEGTVVPFTLYQLCIDIIADKQWQVRRAYDRPDIPADVESSARTMEIEYNNSGIDLDNILGAFLAGSGIAGCILAGYTAQMSQSQATQSLSSTESAAKAVFAIHQILGIVILIELGVEAAEVIKMLLKANDATPDLENLVHKYENKEERRKVLEEAGFEPDKFDKSQELNDSITVVEYCHSWIESHLAEKPGVYDHWVAYGNVVARQNIVRSALDSATQYSLDFSKMFDRDLPSDTDGGDVVVNYTVNHPHARIHSSIASHFNTLQSESSRAYDEILNTFMYQIHDDDLCCLIEIFGAMDTGALRLMASILRIAAIDLQAEILRLMDGFMKQLVNAATAPIYKMIGKLNKAANDLAVRMLEVFEEMEEKLGLEMQHCFTFKDLKIALLMAIDSILRKINLLLMEVIHAIEQLGTVGYNNSGVWEVPMERRYLLSTAEVLETLANKLDAASVCDHKDDKNKYEALVSEAKDAASYELTHTLLEKSPPSIQISDNDIRKYFPDLQPSTSTRFGFTYGPKTVLGDDVGRRDDTLNTCGPQEMTEERKSKFKTTISAAMANAFGRQDG